MQTGGRVKFQNLSKKGVDFNRHNHKIMTPVQ